MPITKIEIRNFRSIGHLKLDINGEIPMLRCFIGKNGVGKSNILNAVRYYWENLYGPGRKYDVLDKVNPYNKRCTISITFDLKEFQIKIHGNQYLKKEFENLQEECKEEIQQPLAIAMTQDRNGNISWDHSVRIRKIVKALFPLYYIDTRRLDLFTWEHLWGIISDLASTVPDEDDVSKINDILDAGFQTIYGEKYTKSKNIVEKVFMENQISMDRYHYDSRFKNTFSMRFGGDQFNYGKRALSYYSDGSNSFMYLKLLLEFISQISDISCKSPVMLIDEPEIGLHSSKITELVKIIRHVLKKHITLLVNTHSPRLLESIVNQRVAFEIYHVTKQKNYTVCKQMNKNLLLSGQHMITIMETSCYFADALLFVEGQSEVQLFNNERLAELFPFLEQIEVYSINSNDQLLRYVQPKDQNLGIPYLLMYDMDKIIKFYEARGMYKAGVNGEPYNPLYVEKNKVDYWYHAPNTQYDMLLRHFRTLKKHVFRYKTDAAGKVLHYVEDNNFDKFITCVKRYCELFHLFIARTTIEGFVITESNIDKFAEFYRSQTKQIVLLPDGTNKVIEKLPKEFKHSDKKECAALVRVMFHGRGELSKNYSQIQLSGCKWDKTDRWIPAWLEYYFDHYLDPLDTKEEKINQFKTDFPELDSALQMIRKMLQ